MSATSNDPQPVNAILELLQNSDPSVWPNSTKPTAKHYYADPQGDRGPAADQPPILYVWNPTDGDIESFSADNSFQVENLAVEIQVWTLDESESTPYQRALAQFMSEYARDNYSRTDFHELAPNTQGDYRHETPARQTNHYVTTLEVSTSDLQATGV